MNQIPGILIVDDDPHIIELLSVNLRSEGYQVAAVEDGEEAIALLHATLFDLVILDVMMPRTDGWEVCKYIRDTPQLAGMKIVMLTAKDSQRDRIIGKAILGADEYLTKPFDIDRLLLTIQDLLYA